MTEPEQTDVDWSRATPADHAARMCELSDAALRDLVASGASPEQKVLPRLADFLSRHND